jgi:hypothetical protein
MAPVAGLFDGTLKEVAVADCRRLWRRLRKTSLTCEEYGPT